MSRSILVIGLTLAVVVLVPQSAILKTVPPQALDQTGSTKLSVASIIGGAEEVREEFNQTYPLSLDGRLVLENLNGGVKISVWDRNEVQVQAVKRAYNRERLAEAKIDIAASPEVIRIRTRYPERNQVFRGDEKGRYDNPATVDYSLTIPRKVRLESVELINGSLEIEGAEGDVRASCVNGKLKAVGLAGEARLSTVNGSLEATFTRLEAKPISLSSVNGSVTVFVPSNVNAVVRAGTVHGSISNVYGLQVEHGTYVGHTLYGQLGTGGPLIKLSNVNGGIHIKNLQDGIPLSKGTSLLSLKEKEKAKEKNKDVDDEASKAMAEIQEASREITVEARAVARESARAERRAQMEARREIDRALREAQREIQRAQLQVQQDVRRQLREQLRNQAVGTGKGSGTGRGVGEWRVTDKETKTFSVTGTPRVQIATFDGTIKVHGWDKSEVSYTAVRRAATEPELKNIVIKTDQQGATVSIIAHNADGDGSTDLDVYVPRNASLNVSSGDGRLALDGVSGDLTLRTGDGSLEVSNARGTLKLNTGDGPIKVVNFEGQLDARTGDGAVSLDGNFTGLAARTGSGSVILSVPAGSNFTIETNAEGVTNEGVTIAEEVAPSRRMRRWRVGQGGNIFTIGTGDGKVILRAGTNGSRN